MRAKQRDLAENFGHETTLLSKSELRAELGSDYYHGALLDPLSAALHVGKFVHGLAEAAERAGAEIHERNAATGLTRLPGGGFLVETLHGTIRAKQVMAATDAYTDKTLPWFRKRLINVGSFIIVTEPLGEELARELIPNGPPAGRLQEHRPLHPPHPGQPPRLRRPGPLRPLRPRLRPQERRRPEAGDGRDLPAAGPDADRLRVGRHASASPGTACRTRARPTACTTPWATAATASRWPPTWAAPWPR